MSRPARACLLFGAALLAASAASAQFVPLSRCRAAYPCAFPFGVQWKPDPLVAGQYGGVVNTGVAARVDLRAPLSVELEKRPVPTPNAADGEAVDAAVRRFLDAHPPAKKPSNSQKP